MPDDVPPWPLVRRGERADHHVLRVGEDVFADPRTGERRERVIIDADEWCNVLPLTATGEAVLVRQFRFGSREAKLELPGGVVEPGEDPARAVARELEEETGYRPGRLVPLGAYRPNPAHFTNRCHAFVALDCARVGDGAPDHGEDLALVVVARSELPLLVERGEIDHALHLATLHLAAIRGFA